MNPQELRIGNWVRYEDGNPVQVREIFCHDEGGMPGDEYCINHTILEAYEPIPLTPEILEAAGFVLYGGSWMQKKFADGARVLSISPYLLAITISDENYDSEILLGNAPQYLHQLQNLFFALTGTELEINIHANKQTT